MKRYNFSIRPQDCTFIVDEENRKVSCVLENTAQCFIKYINDHSKISADIGERGDLDNPLKLKLYMPNQFIGVATCSADDEWDEKKGRAIAFSRVKDKVTKSFFKRANTYFAIIDRWLDETAFEINVLGEKLERNRNHRHEYITRLVGEPDEK